MPWSGVSISANCSDDVTMAMATVMAVQAGKSEERGKRKEKFVSSAISPLALLLQLQAFSSMRARETLEAFAEGGKLEAIMRYVTHVLDACGAGK
jgi:hypothetical protein